MHFNDHQHGHKIKLELAPTQGAIEWLHQEPKIIELHDYVIEAFVKLLAGGYYGIHHDEIRVDALARLEQAGIAYRCYGNFKRGTENEACWIKLAIPKTQTIRVIEGGVR